MSDYDNYLIITDALSRRLELIWEYHVAFAKGDFDSCVHINKSILELDKEIKKHE